MKFTFIYIKITISYKNHTFGFFVIWQIFQKTLPIDLDWMYMRMFLAYINKLFVIIERQQYESKI